VSDSLAPQPGANLPAVIHGDQSIMESQGTRLATSLDPQSPEDRELLMAAMSADGSVGEAGVGQLILANHFVLRDIQRHADMDDKRSPLVAAKRLTLIGPEGECYHTSSEWCIRSFLELCWFIGKPPWEPARRLLIAQAGRTYKFQLAKE